MADRVCLDLEFGAFAGLPPGISGQAAALVVGAVRRGGEVDNAPVHTDPVDRFELFGLGEVTGGDQEPFPAPLYEIGLAPAVLGQRFELVRRPGIADAAQPTLHVQIDTVRASICQDRHRSSKGCAASGRKKTGELVSLLLYRWEPGLPSCSALRLAASAVQASTTFFTTRTAGCAESPNVALISAYASFCSPLRSLMPVSKARRAGVIGGPVAGTQSRFQCRRLLGRRQ
ncbi:hypothetical protein ACWC9U_11670 [Streptomyces sp. 900116325]